MVYKNLCILVLCTKASQHWEGYDLCKSSIPSITKLFSERRSLAAHGWKSQQIEICQVPLPKLPVKKTPQAPTIDDLPSIRRTVGTIYINVHIYCSPFTLFTIIIVVLDHCSKNGGIY